MIADALLDLLFTVAGFVVGLFPDFPAPAWMTTTLPGWIDTVAGWFDGLSNWLPVEHFVPVLAFAAGGVAVALVVRLVRIVLSFLTAGGGSAA